MRELTPSVITVLRPVSLLAGLPEFSATSLPGPTLQLLVPGHTRDL